MDEKQVLTAKEASEYLRISYWLVIQLVKRNEIPHHKWGKRIFFNKEILDEFIMQKEKTTLSKCSV